VNDVLFTPQRKRNKEKQFAAIHHRYTFSGAAITGASPYQLLGIRS
jgi:hypothetical protein